MEKYFKPIIAGLAFGSFFGLIEFFNLGFNLDLYSYAGLASFGIYLTILIWLIYSLAKTGAGFGERVLYGIVFSMVLGFTYGLFAGIAGYFFIDKVVAQIESGFQAITDLGVDLPEDVAASIESEAASTTALSIFFSELFSAILFNLFFGSLFSLIISLATNHISSKAKDSIINESPKEDLKTQVKKNLEKKNESQKSKFSTSEDSPKDKTDNNSESKDSN